MAIWLPILGAIIILVLPRLGGWIADASQPATHLTEVDSTDVRGIDYAEELGAAELALHLREYFIERGDGVTVDKLDSEIIPRILQLPPKREVKHG